MLFLYLYVCFSLSKHLIKNLSPVVYSFLIIYGSRPELLPPLQQVAVMYQDKQTSRGVWRNDASFLFPGSCLSICINLFHRIWSFFCNSFRFKLQLTGWRRLKRHRKASPRRMKVGKPRKNNAGSRSYDCCAKCRSIFVKLNFLQ